MTPPRLPSHLFLLRALAAVASLVTAVPAAAMRPVAPAPQIGTPEQRVELFQELVAKIETREPHLPLKEQRFGFEIAPALLDVEDDFYYADTPRALWYALARLAGTRRDRRLHVRGMREGLVPPASLGDAPVRLAPDFTNPDEPRFFVVRVAELGIEREAGEVLPGDVLLEVQGQDPAEHMALAAPYLPHSTPEALWWAYAEELGNPRRLPSDLRGAIAHFRFKGRGRPSVEVQQAWGLGQRERWDAWNRRQLTGYIVDLERPSFRLYRPKREERRTLYLEWRRFRWGELERDVPALIAHAQERGWLEWDLILDITETATGSDAWYVLRHLTPKPFRVTSDDLRISDASLALAAQSAGATHAPLARWMREEVPRASEDGLEYAPPIPFRARPPLDEDGLLQPAKVHFSGRLVALFGPRSYGASDRLAAMIVDNELGHSIGMAMGGASHSWSWAEPLILPGSGRRLLEFSWSLGRTLRPNGEALEGNPAVPAQLVPLTADNYNGYRGVLVRRALRLLGRR